MANEQISYRKLFEKHSDTLFILDTKGTFIDVTQALEKALNIEVTKLINTSYKSWVDIKDLSKLENHINQVVKGKTEHVEFRLVNKENDTFIHVETVFAPIHFEKEIIGIYGLAKDVTYIKELERNLKMSEDKLHTLVLQSREILEILNENGEILFTSPSIENVLGYNIEETTNTSFYARIHPDDLQMAQKTFRDITRIPNTPVKIELRLKHKNGDWLHFEIRLTNFLHHSSIQGIVCNYHNITAEKKAQSELNYIAKHDYLTDLPNLKAFKERLELELRLAKVDQRSFAVMLLNLDGFNVVNESFGFDRGDLLLQKIASTLLYLRNNHEDVVSRINGDEFAILFSNVQSIEEVEKKAKELHTIFQKAFPVKGDDFFITASIGISIYPESADGIDELIQTARIALQDVKNKGKNHFRIYTPTLNNMNDRITQLQNEFPKAFNDNQLKVYYQPTYDTDTKQIASAAGLIRWDHPERGAIFHHEVLKLALQSGYIIPLSEWLLKTMAKQVSSWQSVKMTINLPVLLLLQPDFLDTFRITLRDNDIQPTRIELQINGSIEPEHENRVLDVITKLREYDVKLILSDFGTEYNSFANIQKFNPDFITLGESFIDDLPKNQKTAKIVTSIVELFKTLGFNVVAEGVKTKSQFTFLSQLGCGRMRGPLFSPSVSQKNFEKMLNEQHLPDDIADLDRKEERRAYFRINFKYPMQATMTVAEIKGKKVQLGSTKVLIEDIGPGGLRFASNVKLPVRSDVVLKFDVKVFNQIITLYGTIVRYPENEHFHEFGVKIIVDKQQREHLVKLFNHFQVQLRDNPLLPDHNFITESIPLYFKKETFI